MKGKYRSCEDDFHFCALNSFGFIGDMKKIRIHIQSGALHLSSVAR